MLDTISTLLGWSLLHLAQRVRAGYAPDKAGFSATGHEDTTVYADIQYCGGLDDPAIATSKSLVYQISRH